MTTINFTRIQTCIYCFTQEAELTDEHIVPYALNGRWVLREASCTECNKLTTRFERNVCRELLASTRAYHEFQTRRPKERPTHVPLTVIRGDIEEKISVPISEYGAVTNFALFEPPAKLLGKQVTGIIMNGQHQHRYGGMDVRELAHKYNANGIGFIITYSPTDYAKLIGKIAYGFAVGYFGLEAIEEVYVLPALRNEVDDIGNWVGISDRPLPQQADMGIELGMLGKDIIARVQLFGEWPGSPTYMVVVGRLKEEPVETQTA